MASRLIIVSNRVAIPDSGETSAGGLAVAVNAALKQREGVWFGWSGRIGTDETVVTPSVVHRGKRSYMTLDLSEADFQEYYNGFANRVLWPIFHYRVDLAEFTSADLDGYLRVNAAFARSLSGFLKPDDVIWVHDYHLLPLARELRRLGHDNPIGFFLHTPCPPPDILQALPQHAETVGTLMSYDLVGLQTEQDAANIGGYFDNLGATHGRSADSYELDGLRVRIRAFPVGIATAVYARASRGASKLQPVADLRVSLLGTRLILGVDRLDYSKGIPHRIRAFGTFLDRYPDWANKVTFLQVTPTSRTAIPEYRDVDRELSQLIGQVNGHHADASWTPIRYVNRAYSRTVLAGFYRLARIALVTPLRDGMNLVAKEFVAAQDPDDPGVLVLSQFAGAVENLKGAIVVNPHEAEAMAEAIRQALEMPLEERRERHGRMFSYLMENDIDRWAEEFLLALGESRHQPGLLDSLRRLLNV